MSDPTCAHLFAKFRRWPVKLRWRCELCGLVTRHYDGADRTVFRPIHPHMSVAVRGYNTGERP